MKKLIAVLFALCLTACAVVPGVPQSPQVENTEVVNGPIPTAKAELDGLTVILYDTACADDAVLAHLRPEVRAFFQRAQIVTNGAPLEACYRNYPEQGAVFIMDAEGDYGALGMDLFTPHQPL